jgi:hypothetical protein
MVRTSSSSRLDDISFHINTKQTIINHNATTSGGPVAHLSTLDE